MASEAGKGSNRRPAQVSQEEIDKNWDTIFKKTQESIKDNDELYKKLSRIDTIGQNGNDGLHYDSDDAVDRWSAVLRDEYDTKYWKDQ
jgi:hypothetical protein